MRSAQSADYLSVAPTVRRASKRRRGISLLEVLISMFVMLVGVISVFALITLGRFEMLEGTKADQAMALGRRGQHQLLARGYLRPLQFDANSNQYVPMWLTPAGLAVWGPAQPETNPEWPVGTSPSLPFDAGTLYPYAIDPLGVAANSTNALPPVPNATTSAELSLFPAFYLNSTYSAPAVPMNRITLRSSAYFTSSATPIAFYHMGVAQADAIFRSQDDLVLNPTVGDYPPTQEFALTVPATGNPTRRQSNGDYSWLATVVPTQGDTRQCIVSVVVFYKRNFLLPTPTGGSVTDPKVPPPERMVNVTAGNIVNSTVVASGSTNSLGGGEVVLSCPISLTGLGSAPSDYVKVKHNQWIMLSQTPGPPGWWRWYRVAATSDPVQGTDASGNPAWLRAVTLAGPDWNPSLATTYASIFDDVIGVYERNMELGESGALSSPN